MPNIAGRYLREQQGRMLDYFGRSLLVRNFSEGSVDEYGDRSRSLDSEITIEGMLTQPDDPQEVSSTQGQTTTVDAEILVPEGTTVTDGSDSMPYPSEIRDVETGQTYTCIEVFAEDNGWLRVTAVSTGYEGS